MKEPGTSDRIAAAVEDALARRVARRVAIGGAVAFGVAVPGVARAKGGRGLRQATPIGTSGPAVPPVAEQRPEARVFSGVSVTDPYAWLEDPNDPEVIAYLEAENAYTEAVMAPTQALQETLYQEMLGRVKQTDTSVPTPIDGWFYYTRTEEGQEYGVLCRKRGSLEAAEEVLLDLNAMVDEYIVLGDYRPSPDHRYLAYTTNEDGGIQYTLAIKDLETGETLPDSLGTMWYTESFEWAADGQTIFYVRQAGESLRESELYRHRLGDDPAVDPLLFREEDETFYLYLRKSDSREYLFALSDSPITSENRYLRADQPDGDFALFAPRRRNVQYYLEHHGDEFLVLTNEDALNFKLLAAPIAGPAAGRELIPHREEVLLAALDPYTYTRRVDVFAGHVVLYGAENGLSQIYVHDLASGRTEPLAFEEAVYGVWSADNREFGTSELRFNYNSLVTPPTVYALDMISGERTVLKQDEVVGGHDPTRYVSERLLATAPDGTRVPISLVYRRDGAAGPRPLEMDGYGAYGASFDPYFDVDRLALLERGVSYAIAHVRGGQELGRGWYDEGKLLKKKNTFTDFIACAEHLIAEGKTAADRLLAYGASAGGLLMGAVANERPDLFAAIVADVPYVDTVRLLDASIPLTTAEYDEWGDPNDPVVLEYLRSYSPYDNVRRQAYPRLYITAGLNDEQVPYWQPVKWAARLRATKTNDLPLLMRTNLGAGHGGASGFYEYEREVAFFTAYVLVSLGVVDVAAAAPGTAPVARAG